MKTAFLIIVCGAFLAKSLTGQINKNPYQRGKPGKDSLLITPFFDDHNSGKLHKKFNLPDNILINPDSFPVEKHFQIEMSENKSNSDKLREEKYPGADRFYTKREYLLNHFDRSFAIKYIKPKGKLYLIVKDPVTNKIIN